MPFSPNDPLATIEVLRYMEWERIKGGLNALLKTFPNASEKANLLREAFDEFVVAVEDLELHD
jgi:hypothetical protein